MWTYSNIIIDNGKDNDDIINLLNKINDKIASIAALSERKVLSILEGDCHTAVGVFSKVYNVLSNSLFLILLLILDCVDISLIVTKSSSLK